MGWTLIDHGHGVRLTGEIPTMAMDWRNIPEVRAWCREVDDITSDQQARWESSIADRKRIKMYGIQAQTTATNNVSYSSVVEEVATNWRFVGVCGLTGIHYVHGTAEWSLYIAPEYQGNGYATKALKTLLDIAFKDLRLSTVWGEIFSTNTACLKLADKLGFTVEGKLRQRYYKGGQFLDAVTVSILREEWLNQ